MPIKIPMNLPARAILEHENIFVMDMDRALSQRIRPLKIIILNLMPLKEKTETELLRALSNTPLQVEVRFLKMMSHESKNTAMEHLDQFYITFHEIRKKHFDGLIITGAPVENMEFEEITYWDELKMIMDWSKTHVTSTMHICWGCQAGLYYHYGIKKYPLPEKLSGIYRHHVRDRRIPMVRSLDDYFFAPHSRNTEVRLADVDANPNLVVLADSEEAGLLLAMSKDGSQIFIQGHPEYDRWTLDQEYRRDLGKGMNPKVPVNYYENDNPQTTPQLKWRSTGNTIYSNWLNFYVYQITPYILTDDDGVADDIYGAAAWK